MAEPVVYLNGEFIPAQQATVSVFDRGFLFGDGVYEVIPAYGGRLFRLEHHLDRLQRSLDGLRIANPYTRAQWSSVLQALTQRAGSIDQSVYVQVTRGVAQMRTHAFTEAGSPTVFAMSSALGAVDPERRAQGVQTITHEDIRWHRCDLKTTAMVANVLLQQLAREAGAEETLLHRDGRIIEGASSNVFVVVQDVVVTPPPGPELLPGITRDLVLELARENGLPWREDEIPLRSLAKVSELWLTSGSREVMPVIAVDRQPIGDGVPGPVWRRVLALFQEFKRGAQAHG